MRLIVGLLLVLFYSGSGHAADGKIKFNLRTTTWIVDGGLTSHEQTIETDLKTSSSGSYYANEEIPVTFVRKDNGKKIQGTFSFILVHTPNRLGTGRESYGVSTRIKGSKSEMEIQAGTIVMLRAIEAFEGGRNTNFLRNQKNSKGEKIAIQVSADISDFTVVRFK